MQVFSIPNSTTVALPAPPSALKQAAEHFTATTGCEQECGLAIALSILAGTAGPMWFVRSPVGAEYCTAFNAIISVPAGVDLSLAVAELRAPLDTEFSFRIDQRARLTEKSLTRSYDKSSVALQEAMRELQEQRQRVGISVLRAADIERTHKLEQAVEVLGRQCVDIGFMRKPWIMPMALPESDVVEQSFDHALFFHAQDPKLDCGEKSAQLIAAGFLGTGVSFDSKTHLRPVISNLWVARKELATAFNHTALPSFIFAEATPRSSEVQNTGLDHWWLLIKTVFNHRLQRQRACLDLTSEAAAVFQERHKAWRQRIATAPMDRFAALAQVPVQALKIATIFVIAAMVEAGIELEAISAEWIRAGFDYAEHFATKLWTRNVSAVVDPGPDIMPLIDRLLINGPMKRREIQRSYNNIRVSELNRWIAHGVTRGILHVEGNLVSLVDAPVSASVSQQPEPQISCAHV